MIEDPPPPDNNLSAQVQNLANRAEALTDEAARLHQYGKRNRHLIRGVIISLAFDLLLTCGGLWVAYRANQAHDAATQVHQVQVSTCVATNQTRAQNAQLWYDIVLIAEQNATQRTAKQRQQIDQFKAQINTVFAPRDCSKI